MPDSPMQRLRELAAGNAAPVASLACLFAAALAASCAQSGLNGWAGLPAGVAVALVAVGLLARLRAVVPGRQKR